MRIIVLGAGQVGKAMARDLANNENYTVSISDISEESLREFGGSDIKTIKSDLSDLENIKSIIKDFDLVIGALPGFMGYRTLKAVIETGKNIVDISFFPEDPFTLDQLAKENNVVAVVDCGVAPGLSNIILGNVVTKFNINEYICYVGGLPKIREWPFDYKAPFSPIDVIEEYIRPARFVVDGKIITKPALTDQHLIFVPEVGDVEAFNTDGLRTLLRTMAIPNMIEQTLRYPGHVDKIKLLKDMGMFDEDEIEINGYEIKPIDFTSKMMFKHWKLNKDDEEITIMRIIVKGEKKEIQFDLYDEYNKKTKISSMARTTGYTCTIVAELVASEIFSTPGIIAPEMIGKDENCYQYVISGLQKRGVNINSKSC